jgi:hypothetical protein
MTCLVDMASLPSDSTGASRVLPIQETASFDKIDSNECHTSAIIDDMESVVYDSIILHQQAAKRMLTIANK